MSGCDWARFVLVVDGGRYKGRPSYCRAEEPSWEFALKQRMVVRARFRISIGVGFAEMRKRKG